MLGHRYFVAVHDFSVDTKIRPQHYKEYFKLVDFALKPQNATIVISSSTFPESRYTGYQ